MRFLNISHSQNGISGSTTTSVGCAQMADQLGPRGVSAGGLVGKLAHGDPYRVVPPIRTASRSASASRGPYFAKALTVSRSRTRM